MSELQPAQSISGGLPRSQVAGLILGAVFLLATMIIPPETMNSEAWAALA